VNSIFSRLSAKRGVNSKNEADLPMDDGVKTTVTESLRTLETEEIGKAYSGRQVVRGVSMQIAQG